MTRVCPKCSYARQPDDTAPDYECPACGIVYDKYEQHHAAVEAKAAAARLLVAERERRKLEAEQRQAAETARKASEAAQRQQADMIAAAIHRAGPGRAMGMGEVLGVLLVLGVLVAIFLPKADVPAPPPAAPAAVAQAKPKPAPVQRTPEAQVAAAEKRERERVEAAQLAERRDAVRQATPARAAVQNSGWDSSVHQVERYLKNALKDPDSYDGIEWSKVVPAGTGYAVRHKYRARNSFGGMVIENQIFVLDAEGNVVGFQDAGR